MNDFKHVIQGHQVNVSSLVHHELHENCDVLPRAHNCAQSLLFIDMIATSTTVALVLLFQLLALLLFYLNIIKD